MPQKLDTKRVAGDLLAAVCCVSVHAFCYSRTPCVHFTWLFTKKHRFSMSSRSVSHCKPARSPVGCRHFPRVDRCSTMRRSVRLYPFGFSPCVRRSLSPPRSIAKRRTAGRLQLLRSSRRGVLSFPPCRNFNGQKPKSVLHLFRIQDKSVYEISCKVRCCQTIAFVGRVGRVLFSLKNRECLCNR